MAAVTTDHIHFGADSRLRYLAAGGNVQIGTGSKVTVFRLRDENLIVGHAGMWFSEGADELIHRILRSWSVSTKPVEELCETLAHDIAQPFTAKAFADGTPNMTEFLVGHFPRVGRPSLTYVSSAIVEPIGVGVVRAIGGDTSRPVVESFRPAEGTAADVRYLRDVLVKTLIASPSNAYDFPVLVLSVSGAEIEAVSQGYYGAHGESVKPPSIDMHIPGEFPK